MKDALIKFARDVVENGIAGGAVAVLALNLDATSAKAVALAAFYGFAAGAISAARRYLVTKIAG